jgi:hypothetical protein
MRMGSIRVILRLFRILLYNRLPTAFHTKQPTGQESRLQTGLWLQIYNVIYVPPHKSYQAPRNRLIYILFKQNVDYNGIRVDSAI